MANVVWTEKCVGCRTCEIACSYHHKKIFCRRISSIEVLRQEREGRVEIVLYRQAEDGHMACNCAKGDEFCLKYCQEMAKDELKAILNGEISGLSQGARQ